MADDPQPAPHGTFLIGAIQHQMDQRMDADGALLKIKPTATVTGRYQPAGGDGIVMSAQIELTDDELLLLQTLSARIAGRIEAAVAEPAAVRHAC